MQTFESIEFKLIGGSVLLAANISGALKNITGEVKTEIKGDCMVVSGNADLSHLWDIVSGEQLPAEYIKEQ